LLCRISSYEEANFECLASYADFVTVGFMHCVKRADESVYEKFIGLDPELKKLYHACGKWLERDDH
jgi:hypothetical protein